MKTRYLFLEFVAGNGREQLWPQCYVVNVIVENDLSESPQRRECHLDGLALLAHLFIEFPRGVGLHPDNDFVEQAQVLLTAKTYGSVFYDKLTPSIVRTRW